MTNNEVDIDYKYMNILLRVIQFAFQKLYRNIWLSLVTITVLILALVSVNFIVISDYMAKESVKRIENQVDLSIYFNSDVSQPEIKNVENFLKSITRIKDVTYISPQKALEDFKEQHKYDEDIMSSLDELDENPLPASIVIQADTISDYEYVIDILDDEVYQKIIASTNFQDYRTYIERINAFIEKLQNTGYIVAGIFVFMAMLIIVNTVRINVYTYREEIGIMKLVGASNSFVRAPFILESVILGIIAFAVVVLAMYPTLNFIQPYFIKFFNGSFDIIAYYQANALYLLGGQLIGVIVINTISSAVAVGRYLKI